MQRISENGYMRKITVETYKTICNFAVAAGLLGEKSRSSLI